MTVYAVGFVHGRGPVFCASMPCANETLKGCGTNGAGDRHRLISTLWDHLVAMKDLLRKRCPSSNSAALPIQVVHGPLGRPHLLLGEYGGPAISFSEGGGRVWAALCGDESDIGIDVAGTDEFQGGYPFHRVFHPQELQHALRLAGGELGKASALLWSVKEAVVKAVGCCVPSRGCAANHRLSVGRGERRVYLSGGLVREGPGAVSHRCRRVPVGTFVSPGKDVAVHRHLERATFMRRWGGGGVFHPVSRKRQNCEPWPKKLNTQSRSIG